MLQNCKWISFTHDPCAFQSGVCWFWGLVSLQEPFKTVFHSLSFYSLPGDIPHGFLKPDVLGACPSCARSNCQPTWWGISNPSLLREGDPTFVILPDCGSLWPGCVFSFLVWPYSHFCYLSWCCPFDIRCEDAVHPIFRSLSEEIITYIVVDLLCPWEEVSCKSFYDAILNLLRLVLPLISF